MGKSAFITGVTGQDGAYLAKLLLDKGYKVHGGARRSAGINTGRLKELGVDEQIVLHDLEILEDSNIQRTIDKIAPDEIYNLAAQSFVGASFEQPLYTANVDALGTMRILEAVRSRRGKARFYQASTSEMFGKVKATPQDEDTPFHPRSPYGVAKVFAHWATVNYRESFGLHASSGILFNHESPLRGVEFVTRKTTLALARIAAGKQDVLELGNIDAKRDWGFAGDYVKGMWLMLQQDTPDDYVLATGRTHTIRSFVEAAAQFLDWKLEWTGSGVDEFGRDARSGKVVVRINPQFYRPSEVDLLIGDPSKARDNLKWVPEVGFEKLVEMMMRADVERVNSGNPLVF